MYNEESYDDGEDDVVDGAVHMHLSAHNLHFTLSSWCYEGRIGRGTEYTANCNTDGKAKK